MKRLTSKSDRLSNSVGSTVIELLIAMFLTGIVASASYQFYISSHNQVMTQNDISDLQYQGRATMSELLQSLRSAGYLVGSHAPYHFRNDSMYIFTSNGVSVDTTLYYLQEYSDIEYGRYPVRPNGMPLYKMLKKTNSGTAEVFSDFIKAVTYQRIDTNDVAVTLVVETPRPDEAFTPNNGYRNYSITERAHLRNVNP